MLLWLLLLLLLIFIIFLIIIRARMQPHSGSVEAAANVTGMVSLPTNSYDAIMHAIANVGACVRACMHSRTRRRGEGRCCAGCVVFMLGQTSRASCA